MSEKQTRKTGYHKPRALADKIKSCHDISCNMIERSDKPQMSLPKPKKLTRWSSGFCKLCGDHMDCLTNFHANTHGYKSADEMIAAGKYAFD